MSNEKITLELTNDFIICFFFYVCCSSHVHHCFFFSFLGLVLLVAWSFGNLLRSRRLHCHWDEALMPRLSNWCSSSLAFASANLSLNLFLNSAFSSPLSLFYICHCFLGLNALTLGNENALLALKSVTFLYDRRFISKFNIDLFG